MRVPCSRSDGFPHSTGGGSRRRPGAHSVDANVGWMTTTFAHQVKEH
ncbi:hypothetical protein HMPREF1550_02219 [Actinomyces sp. oral taxon 877 str. F0543]|nr:hypothetical protein HMPREF1550_02219 [Actinomyces sp. oral taxon 877 str. F0543]